MKLQYFPQRFSLDLKVNYLKKKDQEHRMPCILFWFELSRLVRTVAGEYTLQKFNWVTVCAVFTSCGIWDGIHESRFDENRRFSAAGYSKSLIFSHFWFPSTIYWIAITLTQLGGRYVYVVYLPTYKYVYLFSYLNVLILMKISAKP